MAAEQHAPTEYVLVNARSHAAVTERLLVARASWRRMPELLGRRWIAPGEAVCLLGGSDPCGIDLQSDLLLLDRAGRVMHVVHTVPPFAVPESSAEVHSVVGFAAGTLTSLDTRPGDLLEIRRSSALSRQMR